MDIARIREALAASRVRISDHAVDEAAADGLAISEVTVSVVQGEVIEDYPDDKPYPSCLILGWTSTGLPIHSVWAYNDANGWVVLVTVYRPDPTRWHNWRERRPRP